MDRDEDHDHEGQTGSRVGEEYHLGASDGTIPIDDVLDAVSDPIRRAVLRELRDREVAGVDELATAVAARTRAAVEGPVDDEAREKTSLELAHVHLPELADHGFVEFDRRSSTVRYADPPRDLEAVLRLVAELEAARER